MKLAEITPTFLRVEEPGRRYRHVETLAEAQGVQFECPLCRDHHVLVWFAGRGVPDGESPSPRWAVSGTSLADLTLSPSIHIKSCWHGFVTNGDVTTC